MSSAGLRIGFPRILCLSLVLWLLHGQSALAADEAAEREQLAMLERQLALVDRLAEHAADVSPQERTRYHFDYARLRDDVKRVRAGVQDYLVPQRAQPRDPVPLLGDYVRSDTNSHDGKGASKP